MSGFQKLCLVTCLVFFGLVVLGGIVRATDSGLGCPDWPRCDGSFIPRWEKHTLIEYSHRLTASVAGVLVLGIAGWTLRSYRHVPGLVYPALAAFVLTVFQAGLGGAAVLNELPPEVVAVHLATALLILGLLLYVTATSFALGNAERVVRLAPGFGRLAVLAAAGTFALMLIGSYASGAGYGLACSGWPLCNGELAPTAVASSVQIIFLHRVLALAVGVALAGLTWLAWRSRREAPAILHVCTAALGVFALQSLAGAVNVWTRLADEATAAHLALATLLWITLVVINIRAHRLHEFLPGVARASAASDLAEATR